MTNQPIYITGARGCIGSRLVPLLSNAVPIEGDILTLDFDAILEPNATLVHLAAKSNITESRQQPEIYHRINVDGLKRVADACLRKHVNMLFTSTVHVYGCSGPRINESCADLKAYSPYGATKIAGEQYLQELGRRGLRYTIVRMPGIFGYSPAMHFDTALNQFVRQALQGVPLTVWRETWEQKRPHLYIGDCVAAIKFFVEHDRFDNEVYNLITGNFTVHETIEAIREFVPGLQVSFVDSPAMNPLLDIDNAKICALGCRPTGDLRTGIAEMVHNETKIWIKTS